MTRKLYKGTSLIFLSLISATTLYSEEEIEEVVSNSFLPSVREKSVSIVKNLAQRVQDLILQVEVLQYQFQELDQKNLTAQVEQLRGQMLQMREASEKEEFSSLLQESLGKLFREVEVLQYQFQELDQKNLTAEVEQLRAQMLQMRDASEKNILSPLQESLVKLFREVDVIKNQMVLVEERQNQSNIEQVVGNLVLHLKSAEEQIMSVQDKLKTVGSLESFDNLRKEVGEIQSELKTVAEKIEDTPTTGVVKRLMVQVNNVQSELHDVKVNVQPQQNERVILDNATTRGRNGGFLTGEWLLWQFYEGGTDYAATFDGASESLTGARNKDVAFDWKSGFRVGIGYIFERDDWDLYATYTQIGDKGKKHTEGDIFPLLLFQSGQGVNNVDSACARWKIKFKNADLDLGREFFVSKWLSLHPAFGVKGAWIDQNVDVDYESTLTEYSIDIRNNFSGVGPKLGIGTNWFLGSCFSIYGNIAGALLWGEFKLKQSQENIEVEDVDLRSHIQKLVPAVQIRAGFLGDIFFNHKRNHFGINLGWEMQYWWRQNQTLRFTDSDLPIYLRTADDLSMQGLTLGLRFDY